MTKAQALTIAHKALAYLDKYASDAELTEQACGFNRAELAHALEIIKAMELLEGL